MSALFGQARLPHRRGRLVLRLDHDRGVERLHTQGPRLRRRQQAVRAALVQLHHERVETGRLVRGAGRGWVRHHHRVGERVDEVRYGRLPVPSARVVVRLPVHQPVVAGGGPLLHRGSRLHRVVLGPEPADQHGDLVAVLERRVVNPALRFQELHPLELALLAQALERPGEVVGPLDRRSPRPGLGQLLLGNVLVQVHPPVPVGLLDVVGQPLGEQAGGQARLGRVRAGRPRVALHADEERPVLRLDQERVVWAEGEGDVQRCGLARGRLGRRGRLEPVCRGRGAAGGWNPPTGATHPLAGGRVTGAAGVMGADGTPTGCPLPKGRGVAGDGVVPGARSTGNWAAAGDPLSTPARPNPRIRFRRMASPWQESGKQADLDASAVFFPVSCLLSPDSPLLNLPRVPRA